MKAILIEDRLGTDTVELFDDSDERSKNNPWFAIMFDNVEVEYDEKKYPISMRGDQRQYGTTSFLMPRHVLDDEIKGRFIESSYEPTPWYYFSKGYRGTIKYNGWRWIMAKERLPRVITLVDKQLIDRRTDKT